MRLFGYYALHTLVNQIRKLLKTWVLIFLAVCMLIGGLIGFGAAKIEDISEETAEPQAEEYVPEEEEEGPSLSESLGVSGNDLAELAAGAVILAVLAIQALGADTHGSKIFQPPDVNLLFASPMTPQGVLMFRLVTRLGTYIAMGVYFLIQLPNLVLNFGMSLWAALALIAVWGLTVMAGSLIQMLLYILSFNYAGLKKYLRWGIYGSLGVLAGAFLLFRHRSGLPMAAAAAAFFNAPFTRAIPLWGWLKGFFLYALEGRPLGVLACFAALAMGMGALLWVIWHLKADFYEDAMARSEETARLLEAARSEKSAGIVVRRKKDRSDRLRRDGLRGRGAAVFFTKSMYNRFRFAHLGVFTKTMETYLAAGIGVAVFCRYGMDAPSAVPAALTLAGLAFFRAMGNPLEQDTKMDFFLLIPESTWSKLFFSLLGSTANCLLDALPGLIAAALIVGADPLGMLPWLLFIASVDLYATCVGTFIGLSVPVSAGATIKQIVQVMFIYFGLLPDIAVMAVAMVLGHTGLGAGISAGLNVFLGLLFFALCPLFLEPGTRAARRASSAGSADVPAARRAFSRLGLAAAVVLAVTVALQLALAALTPEVWRERPWFLWAATFAPQYLAAMPVGWLILRKVPAHRGAEASPGVGGILWLIPICYFFMYAGNFLGIGVSALLEALLGTGGTNPVAELAVTGGAGWRLLFLAVLPPVFEELLFRRALIDRMRVYGEKLAVVVSALMFGLFHGNFSQFFYAFALGLVFGYVYLKTNRLRYSIGLHMFINFLGSVLAPFLLERVDLTALEAPDPLAALAVPGNLVFLGYILAVLALSLTGLVALFVRNRRVSFAPAERELPPGTRFRAVALNPGMLVLFIGCGGMFLLNLFGA